MGVVYSIQSTNSCFDDHNFVDHWGRGALMNTLGAERLKRLRQALAKNDLDGLIVHEPSSRRYLSGYESVYHRGYLVVTQDRAFIVTYECEADQAGLQAPGFEVVEHQGFDPVEALADVLKRLQGKRIGVDSDLELNVYMGLSQEVTGLVNSFGFMHSFRAVKDAADIEGFRYAAKKHDEALAYMETVIKEGVTDFDMRVELDRFLLKNGADAFTFESVVLSGDAGAFPHMRPGKRVMEKGEILTVDFGALYNGCDGDVCRTYAIGSATKEEHEFYRVVLEAQMAALAACVPGNTGHDVDKAARDVISEAGLGDLFIHAVGHGLCGGPNLTPGSTDVLKPGMIVALEPAIYKKGWGGMRVEDNILIAESGPEKLTKHGGQELVIL